MTGQGGLRGSG